MAETQNNLLFKTEYILAGVLVAVLAILAYNYVGVEADVKFSVHVTEKATFEANFKYTKQPSSHPELLTAESGKQSQQLQIGMDSKT